MINHIKPEIEPKEPKFNNEIHFQLMGSISIKQNPSDNGQRTPGTRLLN